MSLRNVWEVCRFSDEIVYGKLDMSKFAVELHSVLDGSADTMYKDPKLFLENTFLTSNAKLILKDALIRVSRGEGQPVYIIDTEFGGGKTHTLILLYHFFTSQEVAKEYVRKYHLDDEYGILEPPKANVVAIDCRRLRKNTLWGEIADSLGKYNEIREYDQNRQPIKNIETIKSFFNKPTLLLIDELPHYLVTADAEKIGNVTLADLTINFIITLTSAVSSIPSRNTILIMTLTAKQRLYEDYSGRISKSLSDFRVDRLVDDFREGLSRQVQFKTPVDKKEVYEVIKTRLVKDINQKEGNKVVDTLFEYFAEKGISTEHEFKNNLSRAYPFHSFLIDTLYERVSSIDKFNKTRGMLRLLGLVLHNIYKKQEDCKVVSTSNVHLNDNEILEELTSRIDRGEFKAVIESDCIKKSRALDEKRNIKIFEKIARTIYLYSMIGSTKVSGIRPNDISIAVCEPGIDPSSVEDAIKEMDRQFWYLKKSGVEYYFDKEPQINKIIYDYMQEVSQREIKNKIKETLYSLLPKTEGVDVVVWEKERLDDNDKLKMFVLDYEAKINEQNKKEFLKELLEFRPDGNIRDYQNTIVFVFADEFGIESIIEQARIACAIKNAQKDERIRLDKENLSVIRSRLEEAEGNLEAECLKVYSNVGYPHLNDIKFDIVSTFQAKAHNIIEPVLELLDRKGKLIVDNLNPEIINDNTTDKARIEDIYSLFKKDKGKKFLLSGRIIFDAVRNGVKNRMFGYANELTEKNDGKYEAETGKEVDINWDGYIIKKNLIYDEDISRSKLLSPNTSVMPDSELIKDRLAQEVYNYRIDFNDPKEIVSILEKYPILSIVGKTTADCRIDLKNENDIITIQSNLKQSHEIRSLIQSLLNTNRYSGNGHITIRSDRDLNDEFTRYKIKPKRP